jgi:hypothetical protein
MVVRATIRFTLIRGTPPLHAFLSVREYVDYYRSMLLDFSGPEYVEEPLSCFSAKAKAHLTHGDLLHHILVQGSEITGILDWDRRILLSSGNISGAMPWLGLDYPCMVRVEKRH